MVDVPLIKDKGEKMQRKQEQATAKHWEKGWAVVALRAFSGSFALERRAQDDGKNGQRQQQRQRFWLRQNDEQKSNHLGWCSYGTAEAVPFRSCLSVRMRRFG